MLKSISESIVSGGNKGVSPGTPNIGGGKEMINKVMLADAEVKKGGKKMKKKVLREINKIKEIKFYIKNLKIALENEEEYLEEYDFSKYSYTEKFYFSRQDVNMAVAGIACAVVFKDTEGHYRFFYDGNFMNLSEDAKEFFYYHELGHNVLGHIDQMDDRKVKKGYRKSWKKGEVHKFEYEADFFAAEIVGKWQALTALEEIRGSLGLASSELINKRIKAIWSSELD